MGTKLWLESLKGRKNSEDLGVDGRIILKTDLKETGWDGVDWVHLAQIGLWVRMKTVMNFRVP
jgi:hypothetical protein